MKITHKYLNPSNRGFLINKDSPIYVDKSAAIDLINSFVDTDQRFICVSRPRRFGKSVTAKMLSAYYGKGQDGDALFHDLNIARYPSYRSHLNGYNVIFLNIADEYSDAKENVERMILRSTAAVVNELHQQYPSIEFNARDNLSDCMQDVFDETGDTFIVVIDEWDCILREPQHDGEQIRNYLEWLRRFSKDKDHLSLVYMTGILPIKKYGTHSALNMFNEYSMTEPGGFAPFIGFTEEEVKALCEAHQADFSLMKHWYDGYAFKNLPHVYNPNSVVRAILRKEYLSYWTQTESYEALQRYIDLNLSGLRDDIVRLIAGEALIVDTSSFKNDMTSYQSKDDVLSLLIHLGYLSIRIDPCLKLDSSKHFVVKIPNEEIREEFRNAVKRSAHYPGVYKLIEKTNALLQNIWSLNSKAVALAFDEAHQDHTSILNYNDENSLSCVIALSLLLSTTDTYEVHRELPAGKGFADMVYLPKPGVDRPALLVELRKDKSAKSAIAQIKERNYTRFFKDHLGEVLLVGISYSKISKRHDCQIEKWSQSV